MGGISHSPKLILNCRDTNQNICSRNCENFYDKIVANYTTVNRWNADTENFKDDIEFFETLGTLMRVSITPSLRNISPWNLVVTETASWNERVPWRTNLRASIFAVSTQPRNGVFVAARRQPGTGQRRLSLEYLRKTRVSFDVFQTGYCSFTCKSTIFTLGHKLTYVHQLTSHKLM